MTGRRRISRIAGQADAGRRRWLSALAAATSLGAPGAIGLRSAGALSSLSVLALSPGRAHAQSVLDLDVPFVTTPDNVVMAMLEMGGVGPGDFLLDLGSGDGRIVITAALKHGVRGRGVEIDPNLVAESRTNAKKAGVADKVEFIEQDLFMTDLSSADVITMYLLPDVNIRLRPKLLALRPGVRLVSHDWTMGDWQPDHSREIPAPQKRLGLRKVANLMAWTVPAQVGGRHRGIAPASASASAASASSAARADGPPSIELAIEQRYQLVAGGQATIGGDDYRLATQRIDAGKVELQGQARDGRTVTLRTTLARQSDTIDWQVQVAGRAPMSLRTQRLPEPVRSDDVLPSPG